MPISAEEQRELERLELRQLEAKKASLSRSAPPPIGQVSDPSQIASRPEDRLAQREIVADRIAMRAEEERFVNANREGNVPIRTRKELPSSTRSRLSFEPDPVIQARMLVDSGFSKARLSTDRKNVIVRQKDETGKEEDVLLHPFGAVTLGTVAGETAPLLKTAANVGIGIFSGGSSTIPLLAAKVGVRPLLASAATMGGGAALTEAASTGGSRVLAGQPLGDVGERARNEAAINAAFPLALVGAEKVSTGVLNRLGGRGATETITKEAAKKLDLPLTPSMARDSQVLRDIERTGGTTGFDERQASALAQAKGKALGTIDDTGPKPLASEADVAAKINPIFSEAEQRAATGVRTAMTDAERAANESIRAQLDSGIVPTNVKTSEGGAFIRNAIAGKDPSSKASQLRSGAEKLYGDANMLAQAEGIIVAPTEVSALAKSLDVDTTKALLDFAPGIKKIPQLEKALTDPSAPPLTISQARELRSVVYEMAHTPGPPGEGGVPRRYLSRLYKALDDDLNAAVKSGSPELQQAHAAADDFYKKNIQPLQQSDVAKLFLETDAAGRLGDDEIIRRLVTGKGNLDAWRAYKEVLGETSSEYQLLRRLGVNSIIEESRHGKDLINAEDFIKRITSLNSELQDEILGPLAKTIAVDSKLMAAAQGKKIPVDELQDALAASPGRAARLLQQALERETAYQQEFMSSTQQLLRNGQLGPRTMGSADNFVRRFIFNDDVGSTEVRQALTTIGAKDPTAVRDLRQRTLAHILDSAKALEKTGEVATELMNPAKLARFTTGEEGRNARIVIGKEGQDFIEALRFYSIANEKRTKLLGETFTGGAPEDIAGRAAAAGMGHKISIARFGIDILAAIPRALAGKLSDSIPAVSRYLATGELPTLGQAAQKALRTAGLETSEGTAAGLVLATPATVRGALQIKQDTKNEMFTEPEQKKKP